MCEQFIAGWIIRDLAPLHNNKKYLFCAFNCEKSYDKDILL